MPRKDHVNIALIGQGFMGRTHSNAWGQVAKFFEVPRKPVMHTVFGQKGEGPVAFASNWGWQHYSSDWKKTVRLPEIDIVDIATPNYMHAPVAIAAIKAGKTVCCEKPIAGTLKEARDMSQMAKKAGVKTFVWYNYRRVPAIALAHRIVKDGRIGKILRVRAFYLQDWAGPGVPLAWRFDKALAGSGAHGDLNAHIVDMMRFVTGQSITEICGAIAETFIKERRLMSGTAAGGIAAGLKAGSGMGKVTVDDTVLFLARFSGGAVASFEAARQATGNQNRNGFEINGTRGSIKFDFERMNELNYYNTGVDRAVQGWTNIMVTHGADHPYVGAWWPDAHLIGYEHGFVNQAYDILRVMSGQKPTVPIPNFADAYETQRVLEAAMLSAEKKRWISLSGVK
jgi:predicted dehydrogenase